MESHETIKVDVVFDPKSTVITCSNTFTAEELCILLCKKYGIPPLTRTLFALRIKGSEYYLKDNSKVVSSSREYELRIRFKVPKLAHLITLDEKTYDYYFQQARNDVYANRISELKYPDHKNELMGLGLTDMYRAVLEEKLSVSYVESHCKKYIPKVVMKRHGPFPRKQVQEYLPKILAKGLDYTCVKGHYMNQLHDLAPNYLSEEYRNIIWQNGKESVPVYLHVAPFHHQQPGIRLYNVHKKEWTLICTIEELVYLTRNIEYCLEISRRGTPLFFKFNSEEQLSSFISVCDGYYRLMVKWTFNLSKDDETPSLRELQRIKCHGPVGGAFSYRKLEEKRGKKHGCYILRQCQDEYNIYYLDICTKTNTTTTFRIEFKGNCYILNGEEFLSIDRIVSCHQNPDEKIYLNECIPPSEYDKSQLLLCGELQKVGFRIDQGELQEILKDNKSPRCLSPKDILLYTGIPNVVKPVYITEIDAFDDVPQDNNMTFNFYSLSGDNAMWEFPFCDNEYICEEHTTFFPSAAILWLIRRVHMNYDIELSVRSYHSAIIYLMCDPYYDYPRIVIRISLPDNVTDVAYELSSTATPVVIGKVTSKDLIYYWKWTKLHIVMFSQELQIMRDEDGHLDTVIKVRHEIINSLRWFSVGANYSLSHWAFYCAPEEVPSAYPPECGLTDNDYGYSGSQWVTSSGLPCIPWIDDLLVPPDFHEDMLFVNGIEANKNYCRNLNKGGTGPWCYVISLEGAHAEPCHVRRCSAMDCKVAGTANDYAGQMTLTRSNRSCKKWSLMMKKWPKLNNDTLFPEGNIGNAEVYCRNPSRSLAGAWCFTTDSALERDLCDVSDCAKEEPNIVLTKHGGALRYIYILPEWKYTGLDGGLHFSLKEWNPDLLDGILFKVFSADKRKSLTLYIGADSNEKVILRYKDESQNYDKLIVEKALPHLIPAGKWGSFWLQMPKGGLRIGYQKREDPFFEWTADDNSLIFEPSFMSYQSLEGNVIGVHFPEMQCHTENTTTLIHTRIFSLRMWKPAHDKDYSNLTIYLRGTGIALIPLLVFPGSVKVGTGGITATHRALWKLDQTRKVLIAYKTLQLDKINDHLKDFIELASKWACIQSSSIVRLYGITLNSPTAMVLEYLPYGPFDDYLRLNEKSVTPLQLKKVAATVARALWDLSEADVVHGYIRCRRLLVAAVDKERLLVKLSGPTLHVYTQHDVHWMPIEFFSDMGLAKRLVAGDIWAFATTLWEVFSYGQRPTETNPVRTAKSYEMGDRLLRPERCPSEVWSMIRQSWQADPHLRPRPQEIMRDMNHMLHREYVPMHDYEEPRISLDTMDHDETVSSGRFIPSEMSDVGSNKSLISVTSSLPSMNGISMSDQFDNRTLGDTSCPRSLCSVTSLPPSAPPPASPVDLWLAPRLMESIVSQGKTYLVTLTDIKLGSGNYGRVYKGCMEQDNQESKRREVAVKVLLREKNDRNESLYEDFKNELEIMKSLQHHNIIEILGYSFDEGGRDVRIYMEYMEEGSLNNYLKYQEHNLRVSHLLRYCLDIATGMDHVSAKNIVHRDLATRNILVVNRNHVKITDFGLARIVPKDEDAYKVTTRKALPINWSAPEAAVKPWQFSTKSDVWSYGVTVWEIFTRGQELVPMFDIDRPTERASCFQIPSDCPSEVFRHLMKDCWDLVPAKRPSFIQLVHKCKSIMTDYK